jgi:aspartate aminotransferase, cytoplasmic
MIFKLKKLNPDPILGIVSKFKLDKNPKKINLSVGEFVNGQNVYKFESVRKTEKNLNMNYRYLPIEGCSEFIENSRNIVFGKSNNYLGYQTLSGTGSLWIANKILNTVDLNNVIASDITWPNHNQIFNITNKYKHSSDISDLLEKINSTQSNVFLFQSCCHNPTGVDYENKKWDIIAQALKRNNHYVIMDNAYQGLASGESQLDNYSIKLFDKENIPMIVCSSYAKNFGLYNQRLGSLFTNFDVENLNDYIKKIIRSSYSNPPSFGSVIFNQVIKNHYQEWNAECQSLANRLNFNRKLLFYKLKSKNIIWKDLKEGNGLFYLTPLNQEQINKLAYDESIYIVGNGRINIAGLNLENINYIVEKIEAVIN